jgi:protein-S-isoprenylcysteine O-methyltransferase Ste14
MKTSQFFYNSEPMCRRLIAAFMATLELKIPPPAALLVVAGAMWGVSLAGPSFGLGDPMRDVVAGTVGLVGAGIDLFSAISFRLARTTVNPMRPEKSSALVTSGAYRFSRNPMYVGLVFVLVAWAVFLGSAWALAGPLAFALYIDRFQIAPEERVLAATFGAAYVAYKSSVRRWL